MLYNNVTNKRGEGAILKFVHTADIHLGSAFQQLEAAKAKIRQRELLSVFRKIIDITKNEKADMLFIAGDLFDHNDATEEAKYVNCAFSEIPDTAVFIAAGNHDWDIYRKIRWAENVHIFTPRLEVVSMHHIDIYGASFSHVSEPQTLLTDAPSTDKPSVLVMHGQIGTGEYNPMAPDQLSKFTYCALGHIHKYQGLRRTAACTYAYAGIPEPRGFDEPGDGGVIVGQINNGTVTAERIVTSVRSYAEQTIDISDCTDNLDVVDFLHQFIQPQGIYRFHLEGHKNDFDLSVPYILSCLQNFCFDLQIDVLEPPDYTVLSKEPSLRGAFVRTVLQREDLNESQKTYILQLGLNAMEGERKM